MNVRSRGIAAVVALFVLTAALPIALPLGPAAAAGPPAGMSQIPDGNVADARAPTLEGDGLDTSSLTVYASDHAATLNASIVTEAQADSVAHGTPLPDVAGSRVCSTPAAECDTTPSIVLSDDEHSAGRQVAVRASTLEEALGYTPEKITVRNSESGEKWAYQAEKDDGWIVVDVEHFSSNAVTWTSTVSISGTYSDASSPTYDVSDLDAVDNFSASFTGVEMSETDTVSQTGVTDGGTLSHSVAGNLPATSAQVTFTGDSFNSWNNQSATGLSPSGSDSITVGGNLDPQGPTNNEPVLELTAHGPSSTYNPYYDEGDGGSQDGTVRLWGDQGDQKEDTEIQVQPTTSGKLTSITMPIESSNADYNPGVDIYLVQETPDGAVEEGTKIADYQASSSPGSSVTVTFDNPQQVNAGTNYTIEFSTQNSDNDGSWDEVKIPTDNSANSAWVWSTGVDRNEYADAEITIKEPLDSVSATADSSGSTASYGTLQDGATVTQPIDLSTADSSLSFSTSTSGGSVDYTLQKRDRGATDSPSLDVDGDGTDEATATGLLNDSETATKSLSNLSTGSYSSAVSLASGSENVDVSLEYDERTETTDPSLSVNGNTVSHSGTLSSGTTTSLSVNSSWIQEGTNTVSIGLPSLSADAPGHRVDLSYSHDALSNQSVTYDVEQWQVSQNVSKTFASDRSSASMSMDLQSDVLAVRTLEYSVDGSSWSSVPDSSYTFVDGGPSVDVDVDELTTISDGTTVDVRSTGSRVDVINGSITVLNATEPENKLDSKIQLDTWGNDSRIDVGPTANGERVHYLYGESWSDPSEYVIIDAGGAQSLYIPDATAGSTAQVTHLDTNVSVETGDVKLEIVDAGDSPEIDVSPGPAGSGDPVTIEYYSTTSGVEYLLKSLTASIIRDSDVAQSPAIFEDDDSSETWTILADDSSSGSSGDPEGAGGDGGPIQVVQEPRGIGLPVLLIGALVALILAYLILRRIRDPSSTANPSAASRATGAVGNAIRSVVTSKRGLAALAGVVLMALVVTGAITIPRSGEIILLVAGIPVVAYVGLRSIDQYSPVAFGMVAVISLVLGLEVLGSGILDQLVGQLGPAVPLLAIGALYLAYKAIQAARTPDEQNTVTLNVDDSDDEED